MTATLDAPDRTTVSALLADGLAALGERLHRDGIDAHPAELALVADAVRPTSAALAEVITGRYVAPMRERAFARAARLLLLRPGQHVQLALDLAPCPR
jgi:hypothetical protein